MGKDRKPGSLVSGRDFYLENGLMVLTELFLRQRGFCCKSGCRHCPYGFSRSANCPDEAENQKTADEGK